MFGNSVIFVKARQHFKAFSVATHKTMETFELNTSNMFCKKKKHATKEVIIGLGRYKDTNKDIIITADIDNEFNAI